MPIFVALWAEGNESGSVLCAFGAGFCARRDFPDRPGECHQVEDLIPAEAAEALRRAAIEGKGSLLLIEESLPTEWIDLEWESMTLSGQELGRSILVVRRARPTFGPPAPQSNVPARWLNLFPRQECDFGRELEDFVDNGALRPATRQNFANDVATAGDLFILAHGSESGLQDQAGMPYELPRTSVLPARMWLLACNKRGAMDKLARQLLDQGACSIISASGDLSAKEMLGVVRGWLNRADKQDLAAWLLSNRSIKTADGGIGSLRIYGKVCLDDSLSSPWNELTWKMEHGGEPRIPLNDETSRSEYFAAAEMYEEPRIWERTRRWMASRLLWLAERYDHPSMARFEREMPRPQTARDLDALSSAARRLGHYPQAASYLARGLCLPDLTEAEKAVLLANLTNVLIDLDLPKSARAAESVFEGCIVDDVQLRAENDFKRLDFLARIAAREGKILVALDRMREKRRLAAAAGDDRRELAGLLYLMAWAKRNNELEVARTFVVPVLDNVSDATTDQIGRGNETTAYLLRALAAYYWASQDGDVLRQLQRWQEFAVQQLEMDDPGPWSYTLGFLYLAHRVEQSVFDRAMEALERARYFLETAMFFLLARRRSDCLVALSRFEQRRQQAIGRLLGQRTALAFDPAIEAAERSAIERCPLVYPGELTARGLIPL